VRQAPFGHRKFLNPSDTPLAARPRAPGLRLSRDRSGTRRRRTCEARAQRLERTSSSCPSGEDDGLGSRRSWVRIPEATLLLQRRSAPHCAPRQWPGPQYAESQAGQALGDGGVGNLAGAGEPRAIPRPDPGPLGSTAVGRPGVGRDAKGTAAVREQAGVLQNRTPRNSRLSCAATQGGLAPSADACPATQGPRSRRRGILRIFEGARRHLAPPTTHTRSGLSEPRAWRAKSWSPGSRKRDRTAPKTKEIKPKIFVVL